MSLIKELEQENASSFDIEKILNDRLLDETGATEIEPTAGFVIKTRLLKAAKKLDSGAKVFVNLTHSANIPAPPPATDEEIRAALRSENPANYKVPLSLASFRKDTDKSGSPCLVIDACVHSSVYTRAKKDLEFREFLVSLALQWIEEKEKTSLDLENYSFPKMQSKGNIAKHLIKRPKRPAIVEIGRPQSKESGGTKNQAKGGKSLKELYSHLPTPEHQIMLEPPGPKPEYVVVTIELPSLVSLSPITSAAEHFNGAKQGTRVRGKGVNNTTLRLTASALDLAVPEHYYLHIKSPFLFKKIDAGVAEFDRAKRRLTVTLPTVHHGK